MTLSLDPDDYYWTKLHGFKFSRRLTVFLKAVRRQVEATRYQLDSRLYI